MKYKVGDLVKVLRNSNTHNYTIGETYIISRPYMSSLPSWYGKHPKTGMEGNVLPESDIELLYQTRAEKADYLEAEVLSKKTEALKALMVEVEDLAKEIARLRKFPDNETEMAHAISTILKSGGDVEAIASALKGTTLLKKNIL